MRSYLGWKWQRGRLWSGTQRVSLPSPTLLGLAPQRVFTIAAAFAWLLWDWSELYSFEAGIMLTTFAQVIQLDEEVFSLSSPLMNSY
jgi:hypothetical protein